MATSHSFFLQRHHSYRRVGKDFTCMVGRGLAAVLGSGLGKILVKKVMP
jgi:hypothetical protein